MFAVTGWMSAVAQTQDYPQQTPSEQTQNEQSPSVQGPAGRRVRMRSGSAA